VRSLARSGGDVENPISLADFGSGQQRRNEQPRPAPDVLFVCRAVDDLPRRGVATRFPGHAHFCPLRRWRVVATRPAPQTCSRPAGWPMRWWSCWGCPGGKAEAARQPPSRQLRSSTRWSIQPKPLPTANAWSEVW